MYITKVIFDHYDWIYDMLNDDMQNGFRVALIVKNTVIIKRDIQKTDLGYHIFITCDKFQLP